MRRIYIVTLVVCALSWTPFSAAVQSSGRKASVVAVGGQIEQAYKNRTSNIQVEGEGVVIRLLAEDISGGRHQRFIVRLSSGQTLLIAHNIDLAPRVVSLRKGDTVRFYGEYEWSKKGGTIHWTHHDPKGRHVAGWLRHKGRIYQ